jgi:hypothetical protein
MLRFVCIYLLAALCAFGQSSNPSSKNSTVDAKKPGASLNAQASAANDAGDSVAGDQTVLTIHGVCNNAEGQPVSDRTNCATQMTKAQFEKFIGALRSTGQMLPPTLPPAMRRTIAQNYVAILTNADAAVRAGMEQDPKFQEAMRLARINFLAQAYRQHMEQESRKIPEPELRDYYHKNLDKFEQLTMLHLVLPRQNINNLSDEEFKKKSGSVMQELRARAVQGEDFDKLEKEGFEKLNAKNPPRTDLGAVRSGMYAPEQEQVLFALKPGEVSKVLEQPATLMIFKLVRRETLPFEDVKAEIIQTISNERLEQATKALHDSVQSDMDQKYFGPPPAERAGSNAPTASSQGTVHRN